MPLSESYQIVRGENQMNCDRKIIGITFTISYSTIVTNWFLHTKTCKSQRWGFRVRNWARTPSIPLSKTRNKLKKKSHFEQHDWQKLREHKLFSFVSR